MKAIRTDRYGPPTEVLALQDVPEPEPGDGEVLVRVVAAGLNPADWHIVSGVPRLARVTLGLRRPRSTGLGMDLAGLVEAVGPGVTHLAPGDEVFGTIADTLLRTVAELAVVGERDVLPLPAATSFEEAAGVGVAGTTALRGMREVAGVRAGQHVLVHGASGGVGSFAVQVAVALGAEVTGVCSGRNVDLVRDLGATTVVDHTRQDVREATLPPVDVVLDNVGDRPPLAWRRVLAPDGTYVANFGRKDRRVVGPLPELLGVAALGATRGRRWRALPSRHDVDELEALAGMMAAGRVRTVVGRTHPLADAPAAMATTGSGHARGKVVVTVQEP